ncbi:DUF1489 family protein [Aureimonas sp. AU40]|uniref:DUF1489 family protein n=1 Tax=Aureimonas sp. AU40 TaxID=1637747 RepID=UPI0007824DEF|nr:DUF1489 domain-containing protein [Aureimonas sp. AU40]
MSLHMIKLCVGVESIEDLQIHVEHRLQLANLSGQVAEQTHVTRVMPKRAAEILAGGSLYWVIKAQVQVRQPILRFDAFTAEDGIERCRIVLAPDFIPTRWQPRRAFQGWRYLTQDDAPPDRTSGDGEPLPADLQRELAGLGLL